MILRQHIQSPAEFLKSALLTLITLTSLALASPAWADLGASVTLAPGAPTAIDPLQETSLQITLSNSNAGAPITGVSFANSLPGTLPDGLYSSSPATYECFDPAGPSTAPGVGTLTITPGGQSINLSGGVIPPRANNADGTCTITIPVSAGTSTGTFKTYVYTILGGAVTGTDSGLTVTNSGNVSQSVNVRAMSAPRVTQHAVTNSNTLILGGSTQTLTFRVTNDNGFAIPNFSFTDRFPLLSGISAFRLASPLTASGSCTSGSAPILTADGDNGGFTVTGTLPASGSCTWSFAIEAATTNNLFQTVATNVINRTTNFSNDIGISLLANSTRSITLRSPLLVNVNFTNAELSTGEIDTMVVTWTNNATSALTVSSFIDAQIDDLTAAGYGLTLSSDPTMVCSAGGTAGLLSRISSDGGFQQTSSTVIAAGGTCTITATFTGTVQTAGVPITYTNSIGAGDVVVGPAPSGATIVSQSANDSILVGDQIRISITAAPSNYAPGQPIRYQVQIENFGFSPVSNLTLTDILPSGTGFLTGTIGGVAYTPALTGAGCSGLTNSDALGATTATFGLGTLPGRINKNSTSSCFITYWVQGPSAGGSVSNNIPVGGLTWSGGAASNVVASNTATTNSVPTLAVVNSFSPSSASEGTVSRLTITFSNWAVYALANLSFSDLLPSDGATGGQLIIAPIPNAASTCGSSVITATPGSDTLSMTGGTVTARASSGTGTTGSCFIQVNVIGPAGTYPNSFSATADALNANGSGPVVVSAASNTATLTYASALSATTFFNPTAVISGGRSIAYIRLANSGAGALTGIGLTDVLPAGLTVAPGIAPYSTCDGSPAITVSPDRRIVGLTGARLPALQTCDLVVTVDAAGSGPWVNAIPVGGITADGGVINVNAVSATLNQLGAQSLFVAELTNPSNLSFPGEQSRLRIEITNGSFPVTGMSLTDYFTTDGSSGGTPNGITVTGSPAATTTCTGGTVLATPGGNSVTLTGASMTVSEVCEIFVNVTSFRVGGITNIIPVGLIVTAEGYSNGNQALTSLTTQSNIGAIKSFAPAVIAPGGRSRLTITITNPAASPVGNISVIDNLPAGMVVPAGANPATSCIGGTVTAPAPGQVRMTGGTLTAASSGSAATCTVQIDVTSAAGGSYTNTIQAGEITGTAGGLPVSNPQPTSAVLTVAQPIEVQIAIDGQTLDGTIQTGASFTTGSATSNTATQETVTIRLRNPNAIPLTGIAFSDLLPPGLVLSTTPDGATTCTGGTVQAPVSGTTIGLTGGSLAGGAACTVTANVLSNSPGTYLDDIPVGAVTSLEGASNALATAAELIILDPPSVGLEFNLAVIPPNGISTTIVTLGNTNAVNLTLTSPLVVTLPAAPGPILVAGGPIITTNCGGVPTATVGGTTITFPTGGVIPSGGCTIEVDVTGATPGAYTGIIPAGDLVTNAGPNPDPATAPLVISTQGFISGKVFADNDVSPDGAFTSGTDAPLAGVTIELHAAANCSGAASETVTTDGQGNFLFYPLAAGTYSVCEPGQPAGSFNGITTAGSIQTIGASTGTPGTASNPTATSSQIIGIVLGSSGGDTSGSPNNLFAEVLESEIAGRVFLDGNNDGILNGSETGIGGQTIELVQGGSVLTSVATSGDGSYSFTGLQPGTYTIRQPAQPANTSSGQTVPGSVPNGGTPGTATPATTVPSEIAGLFLPPNTLSPDNNFAEIPNAREIRGQVFIDFADNGVLDGTDYGLSGLAIELTGTDVSGGAVTQSAVTASDGTYTFAGLPEGTYQIEQTGIPSDTTLGQVIIGSAGGTNTPPSRIVSGIALTGATTVGGGYDFAHVPGAAPDLTVTITHLPASFASNNSDGVFLIDPSNVGSVDSSGTITIVTTMPAGITPTAATGPGWTCAISGQTITCTTSAVIAAGSTGGQISVETLTGSGLSGMILVADTVVSGGSEPPTFAGNNTDTDAVPFATGSSLGGSIWRDLNHDRARDPGEPAVFGWTVELLQGGSLVRTATTDATGTYLFENLTPGTGYEVRFREPTNGTIFGQPVPNEDGAAFTNGVQDPAANPGGADAGGITIAGITLLPGELGAGTELAAGPCWRCL